MKPTLKDKLFKAGKEFWYTLYAEDDYNLKALIEHIARVKAIVKLKFDENDFIQLAVLFYNLGQVVSYNVLECECNNEQHTFSYGKLLFKTMTDKEEIEDCKIVEMLQNIIVYFELGNNYSQCNDETIEVIEILKSLDSIDKNCVEAPQYLTQHLSSRTIRCKFQSNMDLKMVKSEVLRKYMKGEPFIYYNCDTYADFVLYKATFVINALLGQYRDLTRKVMSLEINKEYANTIEAYKDVFSKTLEPRIADLCLRRMVQAYRRGY